MKIKAIAILIVLVVLVFSVFGCIQSKGSNITKVMQVAPEDAEMIGYANIRAMLKDPDFENIYDDIVDELSYEIEGIEVSDISGYAGIETDEGYLIVLIGNFDLGDIGDVLKEEDYTEGEYRGLEVWSDDFDNAVAFVEKMIILGDKDAVQQCIRIHKNEEPSMYDNKDMKSVVDKLPVSIIYMVFGQDYMYDIEILAGAVSLRNLTSGDEVLNFAGLFKFKSEADAEASLEGVEDFIERQMNVSVYDSKIRDRFIEIKGEMDMGDF